MNTKFRLPALDPIKVNRSADPGGDNLPLNLTNLVLQNSYVIIMALGMLLVIVAGHIDLSVGSVAGSTISRI